jgi:hypothetical protein
MSLSVNGVGQASLIQKLKSPAADQDRSGGAAKTSPAFGSTPAAAVTLSAKAQAQAKALAVAIKAGHDPDGIQDGK